VSANTIAVIFVTAVAERRTGVARKKTASAFRETSWTKAGTRERQKIGRRSPPSATMFERSARMRCRRCHRQSRKTLYYRYR